MRLRFASLVLFAATLCTAQTQQTIVVDPTTQGRVFDGIGAISGGGGNTRLLIDYPEPQRSQILDYLFKPNFGASLQILKVEIGADMDSTDGAESSHQHTRDDQNYNRGYEWWLMEQAKSRNPNIKLVALAWGAPQWVGNGNYWSKDMIDYIVRWILHAQSDHHLRIDYLGGRNERGYDLGWYKQLKPALAAAGLGSIPVIASDDWPKDSGWNIARDMAKSPDINAVIDIVGAHGPGYDSGYPPAAALALHKPLWDSESHFDQKPPYNQVARNLNRNYVAGQVTATIYWPIVSAMYDNLPYDDIGFIKANQPWSGHYSLTPSLWVIAQTAQFTHPGWRYIDAASTFLAGDTTGAHGSIVALHSPDGHDLTLIAETVDATAPTTLDLQLKHIIAKSLHLWSTTPGSENTDNLFAHQPDVAVDHGHLSLLLQPGRVYTLTTTTGQSKGSFTPTPSAPLTLPYADNFDSYAVGKLPRYLSDMYGGFETAPCAGRRSGVCVRQVVPAEPTSWKKTNGRPFTILGSLDWTDYRVSADILFEEPGSIDLLGRLSGMSDPDVPNAYVLRVSHEGAWSVLKTSATRSNADELAHPIVLASGQLPPPGLNAWHRVSLIFTGSTILATYDGMQIAVVEDASFPKGMVGLGTLGYVHAQFDNLTIERK